MDLDQMSRRVGLQLALLLRGLSTREDRVDALLLMLNLTYQLVRETQGEPFMRGWLRAALDELEAKAAAQATTRPPTQTVQ